MDPGMAQLGTLHVVPVALADSSRWSGAELRDVVGGISDWIVETPKVARAQLRSIQPSLDLNALNMASWSKHGGNDAKSLLEACREGRDMGLISDAGAPGMADPGAEVVAQAHAEGIPVVAWPGPSSFLLGLMSSGLGGQQFRFHGYLPHEANVRKSQVLRMERDAAQGESQWFIETPYRNAKLFPELCQMLHPDTELYIGLGLTGPREWVRRHSVRTWRSMPLPKELNEKEPAIWAIGR
ncbi:MAG: SAM-dependent methyltransferase [Schleiferiaceae bacterium]